MDLHSKISSVVHCANTVELVYNNLGFCDNWAIMLYVLWYQLIPHKASFFLP
jgi:hypothetical protein